MNAPGLIPSFIGAPLADRDGVVAGTIEDLLFDERTHRPVWLLVRLPDAHAPYTFVPGDRLTSRRDTVTVPFAADEIRSSPVRLPAPTPAAREHAVRLCRHFGVRLPAATWAGTDRRVRVTPEPRVTPAPRPAAAPALAEAS
jgi:PRC-barrel domain